MEFGILGPLQVVRDGESLELGTPKQRSLLALLIINANRVITTDRILEELWGDEAHGKENALWVYISRLRSILDPDQSDRGQSQVLATQDHGYVLKVDPLSIDAQRFESVLEKGRDLLKDDPKTASSLIQDALDLWRGDALQEFAYDDFARPDITRLEDLKLNAIEDRFDADLRRGLTGEMVGEIEAYHLEHPYRERPVHQLMLALYRAGRSADALRAYERFRRVLGEELGIEPSPELRSLEEQVLLHDERLQPLRLPADLDGPRREAVNPFKGLRPFDEEDVDDFFGRDRLVAEVIGRLSAGDPMITLVGASGSGKSSAIRAGLLPRVRKGAVEGSDAWLIAQMIPGSHPFAELEAALLRSSIDAPDKLDQLHDNSDEGLLRAVLRILPTGETPLLLVIDQFEELFTLVADEATRKRFLDSLLVALDGAQGRLRVLLTLRADFYDRPLAYPDFGSRMGPGVVNVVPLTPDELEAAIRGPADRSGVAIAPHLLARLISDVLGQPGALPMFQYTLTELFDRRHGDELTSEAYDAMGGVRGAITRRAEELFEQHSDSERLAARQVFLRLVSVGETGESARRRVNASEIVALDVPVAESQAVINAFGSHRLLSFDRDLLTGRPTVEVAHEALLREWERLHRWIQDGKTDMRRQAAVAAAAREWEEAGRDVAYLYTGSRLADFVEWRETTIFRLTRRERDFLDASASHEAERLVAEEAREAEARRLRRSARVRPLIAIVLVAAAVAVGVLVLTIGSGRTGVAIVGFDSTRADLIRPFVDSAPDALDVDAQIIEGASTGLEGQLTDLVEAGTEVIIYDKDLPGWIDGFVAAHPAVKFGTIDDPSPPEGVRSIALAHNEGAYLAGAAAASKTILGRVGFVGPVQDLAHEKMRAGFEAGVRAVKPGVSIFTSYVASDLTGFDDDERAREVARELYAAGVDVIFATHNVEGIAQAAWEWSQGQAAKRWVIAGTAADSWLDVPAFLQPHMLTSLLVGYDGVVNRLVEQLTDPTTPRDTERLGLADGLFSLATSGDWLSDGDVATVDSARENVVDSGAEVPSHPDGVVLSPSFVGRNRPEVSMWVTWRADGTCDYAFSGIRPDDTSLSSGDLVGIQFVNRSSEGAAIAFSSNNTIPTLHALAKPTSDTQLWVVLRPGQYTITCDVGDADPEGQVHARSFVVPDPSACPPGPGVANTRLNTPVERFYDAVKARDANAALAAFSADAVVGSLHSGIDFVTFVLADPPEAVSISNIVVDGDLITWDEEWSDDGFLERSCGMQATIVQDRIKRWVFGDSPGQ